MLRLLLAILLLFMPAQSYAQATARSPAPAAGTGGAVVAGKVDLVEGDVRFFDTANRMRRPKVGEAINEGESIATGADVAVALMNGAEGVWVGTRARRRKRLHILTTSAVSWRRMAMRRP